MGFYPGNPATYNATSLWAGPHQFILPFIEQQNYYNGMTGRLPGDINAAYTYPEAIIKTGIKTFVCPADSSFSMATNPLYASYGANGILFGVGTVTSPGVINTTPPTAVITQIAASQHGGNSGFAAGGARFPASLPDGTSNTIVWIEKIGQCQTNDVGTVWANTTTMSNNLAAVGVMNGTSPPNAYFQIGANNNTCKNFGNASTGHSGAILAGLGDGSVKMISQGVSQYIYNLALIPNDGLPMPQGW